jgi:pyrroloquinoline quinone (PQQ) biosynthesis protein C
MNELKCRLDDVVSRTLCALDRDPLMLSLFEGTIEETQYKRYLVQTYWYVRWATYFLWKSAQRIRQTGHCPALVAPMLTKRSEEDGHELWVLRDLSALGFGESRLMRSTPTIAVNAYIAYNRFQAESGSGVAFYGTAYVLESVALHRGPRAVQNLLARSAIHGISGAINFIRHHSEDDLEHTQALTRILSEVPPEEEDAVVLSARVTSELFPRFSAVG